MPAAVGAAADTARAAPGLGAVSGVRRIAPGLLLAAAVGATAHAAASLVFPYALAIGFEVPLAMLMGLAVANLGGAPARAVPGIKFSVRYVLGLGIILLGLRLNFQSIAEIGSGAVWLVLVIMGMVCSFAVLAGRRLGVEPRVAVLIGIGTAVCGNSAIVAAAPVVRADEREVSFAVATITIFGTIAVFVLPLVGRLLGLDPLTFGLWSGTSVPDTAQTIGASAAYSTVGRDVATIVKLTRTVMLAPLLLALAWGWCRVGGGTPASSEAARGNVRKAFPFFLVGFLLLTLVRTERLVDPEQLATVDVVTRACFVVALASLGLQTRFADIRALGPRPFMLGLGTAGLSTLASLTLILAFGLGPARTAVAGSVDPRPQGAWTTVCGSGSPRSCRASAVPAVPHYVSQARPVWLTGRVLATGIPGAGALSPVGTFHPGGPIHDKRGFASSTRPGRVLDPARLLVASSANFGAPPARVDQATGSILSLATDAPATLAVPPVFAASGGQARALDGAVQLYTVQSPAFLNKLNNTKAATSDLPAVSNPLGISVNNAFGRPWIASSPGTGGAESVLDPDGRPLANAPSERAGGVFDGDLTDRHPHPLRGHLRAGAVANALLGASPDATGRAVFAVATADGALAQVHVKDGVDGLAPPGTLAPLRPGQRAGMVFNWVPDRFLYVSDPRDNAVLQLHLDDNFHVFRVVGMRRVVSPDLSAPVDLAPAVPETANPSFSSNTTLAGGADIYVANRGTGTIARLEQNGRVRAVARIRLPGGGWIGRGELNGIAVSPDTRRIWVSLSGRPVGHLRVSNAVVEVPAFGAPGQP